MAVVGVLGRVAVHACSKGIRVSDVVGHWAGSIYAQAECNRQSASLLSFLPHMHCAALLLQGTAVLHDDDSMLVASLVQALGEAINTAYATESGGRRPSPETKSLVAATAFDDMFAQETSERSK